MTATRRRWALRLALFPGSPLSLAERAALLATLPPAPPTASLPDRIAQALWGVPWAALDPAVQAAVARCATPPDPAVPASAWTRRIRPTR